MRDFQVDFVRLFKEVATDCDLDSLTVSYCISRLKNEGIKFWTVTLPKLAKAVLLSIEKGFFDRTGLTDFAWKGRSLRYFRSLLDRIFDRKSGMLLDSPDASALASLRQLLEYVYKLAIDFDEKVLKESEVKYEQTQQRVASFPYSFNWVEKLRKNAETYYPALFKAGPDSILSCGPRFGPGAVAFGAKRVDHPYYVWKQLPDLEIGTCARVHSSYSGYFKPYPGCPLPVTTVDEGHTAEVLFVPKDSRGPRVISKEPPHIIRPQMAFFAYVSSALTRETYGRINFLDQSVNRRLALEASLSRKMATLDLKDASDSIGYSLVRRVFRNAPGVTWFLRRCRSTDYKLPSGKTGTMFALAGMGSGLTFPLLAFVAHLSICTSVASATRLPYEEVSKSVYVYGDDCIVPSEWVSLAVKGLEASNLLVNTSKSFAKGPFRESCGGDYLCGKDVAPIRLKLQNAGLPIKKGVSSLRLSTRDVKSRSNMVLSLVKHCQELRMRGLFNSATYLESCLEQAIPMPWVGAGSPVLGRYTDDLNKISLQGTWSADSSTTALKAVVAIPESVTSSEVCPYKTLARYIKPSEVDLDEVLTEGSVTTQAYGVVPIPRRVKLIKREINLMAAFPARTEKVKIQGIHDLLGLSKFYYARMRT